MGVIASKTLGATTPKRSSSEVQQLFRQRPVFLPVYGSGQNRVDFIQPVKVHTEDGKEFALLSRDLSPTGIRILGTKRLLGQKVRVDIPLGEDMPPCRILVRVLWTCAVGDDMFENGGSFLEVVAAAEE